MKGSTNPEHIRAYLARTEPIQVWHDIPNYCYFEDFYNTFPLEEGMSILEVGSFMGGSTAIMAQRIRDSGLKNISFYSVDPWLGSVFDSESIREALPADYYSEVKKALTELGVNSYVNLIQATSEVAKNILEGKKFDLVFIDGLHDYEHVIQDLSLWWPTVKPGGVIAGDDWSASGVQKAVKEYFPGRTPFVPTNGVYPWWTLTRE